jgi:hypothetical protein
MSLEKEGWVKGTGTLVDPQTGELAKEHVGLKYKK